MLPSPYRFGQGLEDLDVDSDRRERSMERRRELTELMVNNLRNLGAAGFGAGFGGITIPESPRTAIARQVPVFASALLLAESTAESHTSCTQYLANLNRSILEGTDFRYARSSSRTTLSVLGIPVLSYSTTVKTYRR